MNGSPVGASVDRKGQPRAASAGDQVSCDNLACPVDAAGWPSEARLRFKPSEYPLDLGGLPVTFSGALDASKV